MNFLFQQQYRYIVFDPIDHVRSQIESIVRAPWYDIAVNIAGRVSNDNTFKLYPKLSIGFKVFGVSQSLSVITGRLESADAHTNIHIEVRPNYAVLISFYLMLFIFLFKLIGLFTSEADSEWMLVVGFFLLLVLLRSLIHFSMGRLKNRFERTMLVHPEE